MTGIQMLYHCMAASWSKRSNKTDKTGDVASCEEGVRGKRPPEEKPSVNKPVVNCRYSGRIYASVNANMVNMAQ